VGAVGPFIVPGDQLVEQGPVFLVVDRFQVHQVQVAQRVEQLVLVQHVRDAAAHAGGEVAAGLPEHHHHAAGHVFAAVVTMR